MSRPIVTRTLLWTAPAALVAVSLYVMFRPQPVPVDIAAASAGPLTVTVEDDAVTRIRDTYVISAPVTGRMRRLPLEVGDRVVAGETIVASIEPVDPEFLDPRTVTEARAALEAARAGHELAGAELRQARAERDFARAEADRLRRLRTQRTVSEQAVEDAERHFRARTAALAAAAAALDLRAHEVERARARLLTPNEARVVSGACPCIDLTAPASGVVLQIFQKNEGVVTPGTPLLEVGDPQAIEIVAELLSTEAVRVRAGQSVVIDGWGGDAPVAGRVDRVEPFGYTEVSALGIEEQRVRAIIEMTDPPERWKALGHGYRVEVRIVVWHRDEALSVPVTALARDGERWSIFTVESGLASRRPVELGQAAGLQREVVGGLAAGERFIVHPSDRIHDGVRVVARR